MSTTTQAPLDGLVSQQRKPYSHTNVKQLATADLTVECAGEPPDRRLIESIRLHGGIQQPILVTPVEFGWDEKPTRYLVIEGRRRVMAARLLDIDRVPAVIDTRDDINIDVLGLTANYVQSQNPPQDYERLCRLLRSDGPLQHTMASVEAVTGMSQAQIKSVLATGDALLPSLMQAVRDGLMSWSAAKTAATFPPGAQDRVLALIDGTGKVTEKQVREIRQARATEARETLPERLFEDRSDGATPEAEAYQVAAGLIAQAIAVLQEVGRQRTLAADVADDLTILEERLRSGF